MAIYLVQHGKNLPEEVDPDKGLSEDGKRDVRQVAEAAGRAGLSVTSIRHSGKKRALQTVEIFQNILKPSDGVWKVNGLGPLDDVSGFEGGIEPNEDTMFVGHLPFMEKLVSFLTTGSQDKQVLKFQKGGLVCLEKDREGRSWVIQCMLMPGMV